MNNAVYYVLVIVAGYFCGCIESGYLVGKLCGMDIRDYGSGNSGIAAAVVAIPFPPLNFKNTG